MSNWRYQDRTPVDIGLGVGFHAPVADQPTGSISQAINVALCIDSQALDRFGRIINHLLVGLVDQAVGVRIITDDSRAADFSLGPVQTITHAPLVWPLRQRRLARLLDSLSNVPLNLVHAISESVYGLAADLAEALELDLAFSVTSPADIAKLAEHPAESVGRYLAMTEPLWEAVVHSGAPADRVVLARPGMAAADHPACFRKADRSPTIVCTCDLERNSGAELLIEALDIIRTGMPPPTAFLLGEGRAEGALRRLVRERGLAADIVFARPLERPDAAVETSDFFMRPCVDQGIRGDVLQAMGAGSLVITRPSASLDYLHDGKNAILCPGSSAQSLAERIVGVLGEPGRARAIAATGMEYVRRHHSVSDLAQITAIAYRELALSHSTFAINR